MVIVADLFSGHFLVDDCFRLKVSVRYEELYTWNTNILGQMSCIIQAFHTFSELLKIFNLFFRIFH